jgi:hypothetical protein
MGFENLRKLMLPTCVVYGFFLFGLAGGKGW